MPGCRTLWPPRCMRARRHGAGLDLHFVVRRTPTPRGSISVWKQPSPTSPPRKAPGGFLELLPPPSQLMMVACKLQHQRKATVSLYGRVPTHLEGVEEVPEGPGVDHVVVHGEEEGDDNAGDTCGHGGMRLVSGKPWECPGPPNTSTSRQGCPAPGFILQPLGGGQ